MATKAKTPIQLRFDENLSSNSVMLRLVERQEDETFKTLDSFEIKVSEFPEETRQRFMLHGVGDILGKRVSTIKDGREKFSTIKDLLVPKFKEGVWADGRGATDEQRAVANITGEKIQDIKELERDKPEVWAQLMEKPIIKEEIKRIQSLKGKTLSVEDLLAG